MITAGSGAGGLRHKSEMSDEAHSAPRSLIVKWAAQL